ncbi:hypothetical protein DB42_EA00410 [Neochlamydia sp. EPS4]|uniref:leucine-rich repeat domain-containing protein n=1 Tax=Neochlamydia sp. EPS4 TaxID=1478175 RepID=UPI0005829E6A|nr:leucine-rich repeat domain-containing protein [Neochlamydia sp. EPS4]KIC76169.1 hypothetical protein DB42_EA00410 [Neochlamydia sp. EPS4]
MMAPTSTSSIQAKFHPTISANIEDPVSGELLTRAVTLFPCGHTFNEDTVIQCLARNKLCPLDRTLIERHAPNYIVRQLAETTKSYPLKSLKEGYINLLLHLLEKPQIQEVLTLKEMLESQVEELMSHESEELTEKEKISYKWMEKLLGENEKIRQFVVEKLRQIYQNSASLLTVSPPPPTSASSLPTLSLNEIQALSSLSINPLSTASLYKGIVQIHFPERNRNFTEQAHMLEQIYKIEFTLSVEEKVAHIFQQIFNLATSLSPLEFEGDSKESKDFTLSNYSSYLLNINRLLLWQTLPGGKNYLHQDHIKALPLKKKGELLAQWMERHGAIITELDLRFSDLTFLPPEIGQLSKLCDLILINSNVTALPAEIGQLSQLQYLNLLDNELTALPNEMGQLSKLKSLRLCYNKLNSFPAGIEQLFQLQYLDLSGNNLTALPATIGQLSNLQGLSINDNQLTALPTAIGELSRLQYLDLDKNQITALPRAIKQLSQLHRLKLNGNHLTTLPAQIGFLSNLQRLDLISNQLTSLPAEIGRLPQLQELYLDNNQLTSLPAEIGRLSQLRALSLRNNQRLSPFAIFMHLSKLKNLNNLSLDE